MIDMSWSMGYDERFKWAIVAAQNIAKLLRNVANLSFSMFNYTHQELSIDELLDIEPTREWFYSDKIDWNLGARFYDWKYHLCKADALGRTHYIWRNWLEKNKSEAIWAQAWNWEICNLVKVRKDIRHKEWKNVIIILQDWNMAVDYRWVLAENANVYLAWESMYKYLNESFRKSTIKKIEAEVELVSFWINTELPAQTFSNFVYVQDPNKIYANMVQLFERLIK